MRLTLRVVVQEPSALVDSVSSLGFYVTLLSTNAASGALWASSPTRGAGLNHQQENPMNKLLASLIATFFAAGAFAADAAKPAASAAAAKPAASAAVKADAKPAAKAADAKPAASAASGAKGKDAKKA